MAEPSTVDREADAEQNEHEQPPEPRAARREPDVGPTLRIAAAYSWRLLVTGAAVVATAYVVAQLWIAALAVFLALFATAMLRPPAQALIERGWRPGAAAAVVLAAAATVGAALVAVIAPRFVGQLEQLGGNLKAGIDRVGDWLTEGPLDLSERQLQTQVDRVTDELGANSDAIVTGVLSGAQVAGEILAMLLIALVVTFFFLKDGDRIAAWLVDLLPEDRRVHGRELGRRSWTAIAGYLRGMTVVALFDSVLIGLALVIIGVPAALPLAVIIFFGAYIPIAGAVVTGLMAVLVTLVAEGPTAALAVLAIVVIVQQLESNLLHPVVVGRAVAVHPVAILLAVTVGAIVAGIIGAFVAVPLTAAAARAGEYVREVRSA